MPPNRETGKENEQVGKIVLLWPGGGFRRRATGIGNASYDPNEFPWRPLFTGLKNTRSKEFTSSGFPSGRQILMVSVTVQGYGKKGCMPLTSAGCSIG